MNALPSLNKLKQIIKSCGGKLSEEYSTRLPMNNLEYDHIPIPITRDLEVIISRNKMKIDDICCRIIKRKGTKYRFAKMLFNLLMAPLYKMIRQPVTNALIEKAKEPLDTKLKYFELMPLTDKSITVNEKCNGCGTCAKVCPVNNIKIVDKKPEFQHRCEMCFACDEWCPSNAIQHWSRPEGVKYHHPEVKLSDMFLETFLTMRADLLVLKPVPAAKGIPASNSIIIIYSRHVECIVLMTKCGSEDKK